MKAEGEILILCKNIAWLRKTNGLSKTEMAKLLHIGIKTLTNIEDGIFSERIGANLLFHICNQFHLKIKMLFTSLYHEE